MTLPPSQDLTRLRHDLETLQHAAGLQLPFSRRSVWIALALVPAGLFFTAWATFVPALAFWGIVPTFLVMLLEILLRAWSRRNPATPAERREYTFSIIVAILCALAARFFMHYEHAWGIPRHFTGAAALFFTGLVCACLALTSRGRRCLFPIAALLMAWGLLVPSLTPAAVPVTAGLVVALSGLSSAAVMAYQLHADAR